MLATSNHVSKSSIFDKTYSLAILIALERDGYIKIPPKFRFLLDRPYTSNFIQHALQSTVFLDDINLTGIPIILIPYIKSINCLVTSIESWPTTENEELIPPDIFFSNLRTIYYSIHF